MVGEEAPVCARGLAGRAEAHNAADQRSPHSALAERRTDRQTQTDRRSCTPCIRGGVGRGEQLGLCGATRPHPCAMRELRTPHAAPRRVPPRDADEKGSSSHGEIPLCPAPPRGALCIVATQQQSVSSRRGPPRGTDLSTVRTARRVARASSTRGSNLFASQPAPLLKARGKGPRGRGLRNLPHRSGLLMHPEPAALLASPLKAARPSEL